MHGAIWMLPMFFMVTIGCEPKDDNDDGDWGDDTGSLIDPDNPMGGSGPRIEVDPTRLDFGTLASGEDELQQFTISNVGDQDLRVESLAISSESSSFALLMDVTDMVVAPDAHQDVDVVFSPLAAHEQTGEVLIVSNDKSNTQVSVELSGGGVVPELEISPDPLDMGPTYIGCESGNRVDLTNVGTDDLEIHDVTHSGGAIEMVTGSSFPVTLAPDESTSVHFNFVPGEVGDVEAELTVTSNEPMGTRRSTQQGTGLFVASYSDSWDISGDPPSDIIFQVDQSCSMDDDQARLASNFSTFISELNTYSEDWQIIVSNDDNGCNGTGGVLTPDATDYVTRFQSAVSSGGGGWWTEAGLTVTSEAVEMTDSGECNYGFLRPEAMLHIIMVSDEPEQSASTWDWYVDKVIAKKGSSANVKFSAIAGDYPGGCATAEAGSGYYQAVTATDGVFLSICSEWASPANLAMLAAASIQQAAFELEATPIETSIRVYVNGSERLNHWHYDAEDNSVVFDEGMPEEGDNVRIDYGGQADCD